VEARDLEQVRELFQDSYVRARLQDTPSVDEAIGVVVAAGAARDVSLDSEVVRRLIDVFGSPKVKGPDREELKWVGGRMAADTHVHMSCCTECPSSNALCC
jgi:hypothetical protein